MKPRGVLIAFLMALLGSPAYAQPFPAGAIRILVGFPVDGPSDVPARLIARRLQTVLKQPVNVENLIGGVGQQAVKELLSQPRDGHTLLLCSYLDASNTLFQPAPGYKLSDLQPISLVSKSYYAFTVPNDSPAGNVAEFVKYAADNKGKLKYGSVGSGSITELLARQLEKQAGISLTAVPFRGTGPGLQETAAGRLDLMIGPFGLALPLARSMKVRILGVTSTDRLDFAPDIPTLLEQGLKIARHGWWGMCAASGTPDPIVRTLNKLITGVVREAEYREPIQRSGNFAVASSSDELGEQMRQTVADLRILLKDLGIQAAY